ncbi:hypothetical protein [Rhodococcus jostii]|uniref:hypothetical protein n=1 Tax=Rhodococcus jostii TaxID=132919 RepID=UPI003633FA16
MEVDGSSPTGTTQSIANVTSWKFIFNDATDAHSRSIFASVELPAHIASIETHDSVWVGSTTLEKFPTMNPNRAEELLRKAGYTQPYEFVTLRQPNVSAPSPHPLFIFGPLGATGYVGVDTVNGKVAPII